MKTKKLSTLRVRISAVLVAGMVLLATMICLILVPNVSKDLKNTNQNYMKDLALSYGKSLNYQEKVAGNKSTILNYTFLTYAVGDVKLECVESSYAYVVSTDGEVLYHPSVGEVGEQNENVIVEKILEQMNQGETPETTVESYQEDGKTQYIAYYVLEDDSAVLSIIADESDILSQLHVLTWLTVLSSLILVIVFALLTYLVVRIMTKPITSVTHTLNIMSELNFADNPELEYGCRHKDETGEMSRALRNMKNSLIDIVGNIQKQSEKLYGASNVLNTSTQNTTLEFNHIEMAVNEISQGATDQAGETQQATRNVVEIGTMIEHTKQQVEKLNHNAARMSDSNIKAEQSLHALTEINKQTIESIHIIADQTHTTNESAEKIKDAAKLISDIADETNLLSLNASIEAARAGEAGKGFAVVASQIQKLADQSNVSAQRIDQVVQSLIADSKKSVATMNQVLEIIRKQTEYLATTEQMFAAVKVGVGDSLQGICEISDKADQLDRARNGMIVTVQNLSAIAEENAASTEETSTSVIQVNQIMKDISNHVQELRNIAAVLDHDMKKFQKS